MGTSPVEQLDSRQFCSECGRPFAVQDLAHFGQAAVCGDCKPTYVQRMREGVTATSGTMVYGGFWRRFAAVFIDGILVNIVTLPVLMALGLFSFSVADGSPGVTRTAFGFTNLIPTLVQFVYYVYFLSQKGATLGKMLMGLKVVTATGGPISVGRAIGRYFAQFLSAIIIGIGFIMAAFDDQKRTLHDHICNTRVIRD